MICAVIERFFYSPILLVRHFQLAHDALTKIKLTVSIPGLIKNAEGKINGKITKPKTIPKIANQFGIRCPARLILNSLIQSYRINKNSVITTERIGKITSVKKLT